MVKKNLPLSQFRNGPIVSLAASIMEYKQSLYCRLEKGEQIKDVSDLYFSILFTTYAVDHRVNI